MDGNSNSTTYEYDNLGRLSKMTRPGNRITRYFYDANGNLIKRTDPRGNITVYKYDGLNQLTEQKTLGGEMDLITQYTYTAQGKIKTSKQKLGSSWITTTYDYDRAGRRIAVSKPLDADSYYGYDKNGNWTGFTDAEGNGTVYAYNNLNQLTSTTNDLGVTTEYTVDLLGRRTAITEAKATSLERTFYFEYGNFDKMTKTWVTFNNQTLETTFSYDLFANMTAQTDANGNGTSYTYDFLNRKISKTNAEGNTIYYSYDNMGNWTTFSDPNGNVSKFAYTSNNELLSITYPDFSVETNVYDAAGNKISKTARSNETITFEYDDFNRMIKKTYPDSSETTFDYDQLGRMESAENDDSSYSFTYSNINQLTQVDYTDPSSNEYTVSYEYDKVGNKTKLTYPESYYYYTREYTDLNQLDKVKDRDSNVIADYMYDSLNRRTRLDYYNNTWAAYTYNDVDWLTELGNWATGTTVPISKFVYNHDNVGNRLTMGASFGTQTYSYDEIYEVTGADYPAFYEFSDMTYYYDATWNRTTTINGGTTNYITNSLNQYNTVGGTTLNYDSNGNLTDDGTQTYYYDCENQLTKVVRNSDGEVLGEHKYDPFGKRIQKAAGGSTINYVYDQTSYQVLEEGDNSGTLLRHFAYGAGIDEPLVMHQNDTYYYYHRDGLGSITNLTNSMASTIVGYRYNIYGSFVSSIYFADNPYTFTARRYDRESGVFYCRARYYSPNLGRFLEVDPLGRRAKPNLYNYVSNSPISFIDPYGLEWSGIESKGEDIYWKHGGQGGSGKIDVKEEKLPQYEEKCDKNTGKQKCWVSIPGVFKVGFWYKSVKAGPQGESAYVSEAASTFSEGHEEAHGELVKMCHDTYITPLEVKMSRYNESNPFEPQTESGNCIAKLKAFIAFGQTKNDFWSCCGPAEDWLDANEGFENIGPKEVDGVVYQYYYVER